MANNKAYDLSSYSFSSGEKILIDTNVWIYLFPASGNPPKQIASQYSLALKKLVSAGAQPILDPMVLSEYLNRYVRLEWSGGYKGRYPVFKKFRKSNEFLVVASDAKSFASRIMSYCLVHSLPADSLNLRQALDNFSSGASDFNDELLIDVCSKKCFKLMTNDGDFQFGGIEVLTTNPHLLKACP